MHLLNSNCRLFGSAARFAVVCVALSFGNAALAAVNKWVDKNGVTHFSNVGSTRKSTDTVYKYTVNGVTNYTDEKPRGINFQLVQLDYCFACGPTNSVNFNKITLKPEQYASTIDSVSKENGVDPAFVRAIIHAESAFRPGAISKKGAQGLMQLMPATANELGVTNAFDPEQNIRGGVKYIAQLAKRFVGDMRMVAAAYNAGPGAVQKYGGIPPYRETQAYVERVGILHGRYKTSGI